MGVAKTRVGTRMVVSNGLILEILGKADLTRCSNEFDDPNILFSLMNWVTPKFLA